MNVDATACRVPRTVVAVRAVGCGAAVWTE
jgi:hypothetical protein